MWKLFPKLTKTEFQLLSSINSSTSDVISSNTIFTLHNKSTKTSSLTSDTDPQAHKHARYTHTHTHKDFKPVTHIRAKPLIEVIGTVPI